MNSVSRVSSFEALDLGCPILKGVHSSEQRILDQYELDAVHLPKTSPPKDFVTIGKSFLKHINELYKKKVPYSFREKIKWMDPLSDKIFSLISCIVRLSQSNVVPSGSMVSQSTQFFKKIKILSIFSAIGVTYFLAIHIKELAKSTLDKNLSSAIDSGLLSLSSVSDLTFVTAFILGGLKDIGAIAASEALTIGCDALLGLSSGFMLAVIAYHAKQWFHIAKFRDDLKQKYEQGGDGNDFKSVTEFINEKKNSKLKTLFGVEDGELLKLRLNALWQRDQDKNTPETKDKITQAMAAMKKRLITAEITNALKILAAVISLVASVILIPSPLSPLGLALFATSCSLGISILITDYVKSMQFRKVINHLAPDTISLDKKEENKTFLEELKSVTTRIYNQKPVD